MNYVIYLVSAFFIAFPKVLKMVWNNESEETIIEFVDGFRAQRGMSVPA